jgi:hypothetical protein
MTTNGLDPTKALQIIADIGPDSRQVIELEGRLQAIVNKLLAMRGEVEDGHTEDGHTCRLRFDLGERAGKPVVKGTAEKVF